MAETLTENEIRLTTGDGQMTVFIARPAGQGPFPVAVLYMDGVGYREQIKANARRFAAGGYCCVAPDLFYRSGDQLSFDFSRMGDEGYRRKLMDVVGAVTPQRAMEDTRVVLDAVASDPAAADGPRVCVGYCMGARMALRAAAEMPGMFAAAAGIHPGALVTGEPESPHHDLSTVAGELYFAFAEHDQSATPEVVDQFRQEMERCEVRGIVERLPGTSHGFAMADLPVYDHDAAEHHFERTLDLWQRSMPAR
jgi:carboxymethylenebutenolidase